MITEIIQRWEENKKKLEEYFRTTKQTEYDSYEAIVRKIFEICINKSDSIEGDFNLEFNLENLHVIDDGGWQGTQIFIIPKTEYSPDVDDYIITDTYYGSCSGCDTLQAICGYTYELPTEQQVKEYMTLSLHLVQKMQVLIYHIQFQT